MEVEFSKLRRVVFIVRLCNDDFVSAEGKEGEEKGSSYVLKSESCGASLSVLLQGSVQQPKTVLEALQQRLEKYKSAAAQAKASGDDRKGRMHERIAKVKRKCSKLLASSKAI